MINTPFTSKKCPLRQSILFFIALSLFSNIWAIGHSKNGQAKSMVCSACHGEGISTNPMWPNLAGQHALYLVQQLKHYKTDNMRNNAIMSSIVAGLSEQDMEDLAAFYAQKPLAKPIPSAALP
ncbi:MAG TPA: cytochrome c, partial [Legionellaceae bacterium]|nr:cytochrome c [Legionellaceae bacterium]